MVGGIFGRLRVIKELGRTPDQKKLWKCMCECGGHAIAPTGALRSGNTKSCGCLQKEITIRRSTKHDFAHRDKPHLLFWVWSSMLQRCINEKNKKYPAYGGRGILLCSEWIISAQAFIAWALENGWSPGKQLHRKNNDDCYTPDNCIFITAKQHQKLHTGAN